MIVNQRAETLIENVLYDMWSKPFARNFCSFLVQVTQDTDWIPVAIFLGKTLSNTRKYSEQAIYFSFVDVTTSDALKLIKLLNMKHLNPMEKTRYHLSWL